MTPQRNVKQKSKRQNVVFRFRVFARTNQSTINAARVNCGNAGEGRVGEGKDGQKERLKS